MMTEQSPTVLTVTPRRAAFRPEAANQLTHAFGCLLSLFGGALIISTAWESGDASRIFGCTLYAFSLVSVYAASTLSHSFDDPRRRTFFRTIDQICILILVAATYTPFGLVYATSGAWWLVLATMWTCTLVGIVIRLRSSMEMLPIALFIIMGWLPITTFGLAYEVSHEAGIALVLAGGLAYSGGTWFLANDHRRAYYHALWHLCTITGSTLHFLFLLRYVATPAV